MERLTLLDRSKSPPSYLLENIPWINDLVPMQIEELAPFFQPYAASPGTIILMEGEPANFFCIICEGSVDVVKENSGGKLKKLKSFNHGKVIGEMAFFDGGPSSATIIVKSNILLLVMDTQSFDALCREYPSIALKITINLIRILSQRLRETSGKLIDYL